MRHAIVLTALVGCASAGDAPALSSAGMSVEEGDAVRVFGPNYEVDFSSSGLHLPEHLIMSQGQVDVLGTDLPCLESRVGFSVMPAVSADAGMRGKDSRSTITTLLTGPAVAKVRVTFEVDYDCPTTETLTGSTEFTLFPGGRIVREDVMVAPSSHKLGVVGRCGCQQETDPSKFQNLAFTSFWAFEPSQASQVQADGSRVTSGVYAACTMYPGRAIGVAWAMQPGTGTRFSPDHAASHILDWVFDQPTLDATPRSMTSAIQLSNGAPTGPADCGPLLAALADVPLQLGGTRLAATDHDGIYRDPAVHAAAFTITPGDAAVPPGFVVSIDLGGASHARLTRSPASAQIGVVQRESGDRFLIAFIDGLAPGESIAVEPVP
jgi:hypothetical protein